jgi:RHS repeat-associated protein
MASEMYYAVDFNPADPDFAAPAPSVYRIDANRHFVRQAFDAFGRLATVTEFLAPWGAQYAGEYRTRYTYDTQGRLTQVKDAAGNLTTIAYDLLGRKTSLSDPDMGAWAYGYDIVSNLRRQTDARGQTICFFYDELKRLTGKSYQTTTACPTSQPASPAVSYTYDNTAGGNKGIGRRTGMATNGANSVAWVYDARGRVTSETRTVDGVSYVTDTAYDSADRAATLTYPADASGVREALSYTYNAVSQLTQLRSTTYGLNYASGLTYNALGQLSQITYGNAVQERRGYYGLGGAWDSRAGTGLQFYGKLWRSRAQTSAGVPRFDQRYLYDNAGNLIRLQEAATVSTGWPTSYTFQDTFDSKNTAAWTWSSYQTVPFNDSGNNVVKSAGTGVDWNSTFYRTATLTSGQGLSLRFKVDNTNPMTVLAIETTDSSKRFGVYALSNKVTVQYNDGSGWRYPADLIPSLQANTWYVLRIVLDDARGFYMEAYPESTPGLRSSYQQWLPTGQAWRFRQWSRNGSVYLDDYREFSAGGLTWSNDERLNFGYDLLNRLTSAAPDSGAQGYSQTYQYNAIGNLTYRSDVGSYTYPPSGSGSVRPHAATAAGANYSATYDANGNMLTRTENGTVYTQTWDEENRLKTVTVNGQTTTYTYDGDGRRVKKLQGGQTTVYIGNYFEKNLSSGVVTTYYYAGGQRIAERQGSTVYYFVSDHLDSTSLTTNASGSEVGRQRYYPFGTPRNQSGALYTDYRFTGQRSEEANLGSLYDYGARFYSPVFGRFVSPDSIVPRPGNPQSLNRYSYVRNNPLILVDPSGNADCAADDRACWEDEWEWKNRWYNAHGWYADDKGGWSNPGNPFFKDAGIANDVARELGVYFFGVWDPAQKKLVLGGAMYLANAMRGIANFRAAFPVGVVMAYLGQYLPGISPGAAWNQPPIANWIFYTSAAFVSGANAMIMTVHELAHAWAASSSVDEGFFKAVAGQQKPTWYASTSPAEWFAESVVVAVFGSEYTGPLHNASLYPKEVNFLKGLSGPYVDYLSPYLAVNPSAILR